MHAENLLSVHYILYILNTVKSSMPGRHSNTPLYLDVLDVQDFFMQKLNPLLRCIRCIRCTRCTRCIIWTDFLMVCRVDLFQKLISLQFIKSSEVFVE